jgi:hypothetical protein
MVADLHRQRPRPFPGYFAAIAAAICGPGSGQETGCMRMTYPILQPQRGEERPQAQIVARKTVTAENISRRVAN